MAAQSTCHRFRSSTKFAGVEPRCGASTLRLRPVGTDFSLVAWNIFQGLHHRSKRYRWVPNPAIEDDLAALDADVLVLPEAWRFARPDARWAEELAATLGYELHQWVADRAVRRREPVPWRMVVLTRIPARTLEPMVMSEYPSIGRRAAVRVELTGPQLTLAGVHLYGIHLLRYRRPRAWWNERHEFREICAASDIVAGDMNMWGPIVRRDGADLRGTVRGRTFPVPRPHSQIDHVLVSDRVEVLSSRILPPMGSDHLALHLDLRPRPVDVPRYT